MLRYGFGKRCLWEYRTSRKENEQSEKKNKDEAPGGGRTVNLARRVTVCIAGSVLSTLIGHIDQKAAPPGRVSINAQTTDL